VAVAIVVAGESYAGIGISESASAWPTLASVAAWGSGKSLGRRAAPDEFQHRLILGYSDIAGPQ
jgi:hypothetical protein